MLWVFAVEVLYVSAEITGVSNISPKRCLLNFSETTWRKKIITYSLEIYLSLLPLKFNANGLYCFVFVRSYTPYKTIKGRCVSVCAGVCMLMCMRACMCVCVWCVHVVGVCLYVCLPAHLIFYADPILVSAFHFKIDSLALTTHLIFALQSSTLSVDIFKGVSMAPYNPVHLTLSHWDKIGFLYYY